MDYLQKIWQLEDRTRVIAIVAMAVMVLGLSIVDSVSEASGAHEHTSNSMHMH